MLGEEGRWSHFFSLFQSERGSKESLVIPRHPWCSDFLKKNLFAASIKSINPCHPHDSDISPFKVHLNTPSTGFLFLFKCAQSSQSKLPQSAFNRAGEFITEFRKKLKGSRSIWSTLILKQVQDPSEREHTTRLVWALLLILSPRWPSSRYYRSLLLPPQRRLNGCQLTQSTTMKLPGRTFKLNLLRFNFFFNW